MSNTITGSYLFLRTELKRRIFRDAIINFLDDDRITRHFWACHVMIAAGNFSARLAWLPSSVSQCVACKIVLHLSWQKDIVVLQRASTPQSPPSVHVCDSRTGWGKGIHHGSRFWVVDNIVPNWAQHS
jgi:hypothetical protein